MPIRRSPSRVGRWSEQWGVGFLVFSLQASPWIHEVRGPWWSAFTLWGTKDEQELPAASKTSTDPQGKASHVGRWQVRPTPGNPAWRDKQVQVGREQFWAGPCSSWTSNAQSAGEVKEQKVTLPACTPKSPFFRLRNMLSASELWFFRAYGQAMKTLSETGERGVKDWLTLLHECVLTLSLSGASGVWSLSKYLLSYLILYW